MPKFTPHHFIPGAGIAGHVDTPHIHPAQRLGRQYQGHLTIDTVDLGAGIDPRKGIAESAEAVGEGLGGGGHRGRAVGLARPHADQLLEFVFFAQVVARQPNRRHGVELALLDGQGEADVLLVGRDRDLRGLDVELQVAAVQVVGADGIEVGIELGPRVTVVFGVPGQPAAGRQVHQTDERALREHLGADDADLADAGRIALGHGEADVDAVALGRGDGGHDLGTVETARQVLALDLLLGTVYQGLVEGHALADTRVLERLDQGVLVELFEADKADGFDHRTFFDQHHRDAAVDLDAHVLEQAGGKQRAQAGGGFFIGVAVANAERQRGEHGARVGPLQALDPDVLQHKGFNGLGRRGDRCGQYGDQGHHGRGRAEQSRGGERHQGSQCRPSRRATSLKRATDIISSKTAMPPRCKRASQRSETGRPVKPSKR